MSLYAGRVVPDYTEDLNRTGNGLLNIVLN